MILKAGENQYFYVRILVMDAFGSLHPVHHGHDNIHEDQVESDVFTKPDGLRTVGCLADNTNIRNSNQHPCNNVMDVPMIVHDENTNGSIRTHTRIIWLKPFRHEAIFKWISHSLREQMWHPGHRCPGCHSC